MFRPLRRPIRPLRVTRPVGAPLVRGLVLGGAAYAAVRHPARPPGEEREEQGGQDGGRGAVPDLAQKLTDLGRMVQQGLLTPEEFATVKARLLGV